MGNKNPRVVLVLNLALAVVLAIPAAWMWGPAAGFGLTALAGLYLLWHIANAIEDLRESVALFIEYL